ncbi:centromere protein B, putative, partial [Ixodes scapularis]
GALINVQPEMSLCFKGQTCKAGQKSKQRTALLFCCNDDGSEKMKLTVIGRIKKSRCFIGAGRLSCIYKANKKFWMTGAFFQEFLTYLDNKTLCKGRNILLFLDQCAAH